LEKTLTPELLKLSNRDINFWYEGQTQSLDGNSYNLSLVILTLKLKYESLPTKDFHNTTSQTKSTVFFYFL